LVTPVPTPFTSVFTWVGSCVWTGGSWTCGRPVEGGDVTGVLGSDGAILWTGVVTSGVGTDVPLLD
jgi:hypothetical protein